MYKQKAISPNGFRAYVYGREGEKKLVNSWDEFMSNIRTGNWFATKGECFATKILEEHERHAAEAEEKEIEPDELCEITNQHNEFSDLAYEVTEEITTPRRGRKKASA